MTLKVHTMRILHTTQFLPRPRICNMVGFASLQLRNLTPLRSASGTPILGVEHKNQRPVQRRRRAGPVLCRMRGIKGPVRVVAPFIRVRGTAVDRVLVELD